MNGWLIILFYLLLVTVFFVTFSRLMSHGGQETSKSGIHEPAPNKDVIIVKAADKVDTLQEENTDMNKEERKERKDDEIEMMDDAPIIDGYLGREWWNKLAGIDRLGTNEQAEFKATLRSFGYIAETDIPILIKKKDLLDSAVEGNAGNGGPDEGPGINPEFSDEEKAQNDFAGQYGRYQRSDEEFDPDDDMGEQM